MNAVAVNERFVLNKKATGARVRGFYSSIHFLRNAASTMAREMAQRLRCVAYAWTQRARALIERLRRQQARVASAELVALATLDSTAVGG